MEDILVRELPTKSSVDINDYAVIEDFNGTHLAKLEDLKSTLNSHLYFDSLDDLLNASLNEGDVCVTLGRHDINDGGNGMYQIINSPMTQQDYVTTFYLNTSDTLRAVLINDGSVTVEQAGAYGDGLHDDYTAITRAINSGKNVIFGEGKTYLTSKTIELTTTDYMVKHIDFNHSIIYTSATTGISISIGNSDKNNVVIEKLGDIRFSETVIPIAGIAIIKSNNVSIKNSYIGVRYNAAASNYYGIMTKYLCKNLVIDSVNITRELSDDDYYTDQEYIDHITELRLNTVSIPSYHHVLKRQFGIGIRMFDIDTESDTIVKNPTLNSTVICNNVTMNNLQNGFNIGVTDTAAAGASTNRFFNSNSINITNWKFNGVYAATYSSGWIQYGDGSEIPAETPADEGNINCFVTAYPKDTSNLVSEPNRDVIPFYIDALTTNICINIDESVIKNFSRGFILNSDTTTKNNIVSVRNTSFINDSVRRAITTVCTSVTGTPDTFYDRKGTVAYIFEATTGTNIVLEGNIKVYSPSEYAPIVIFLNGCVVHNNSVIKVNGGVYNGFFVDEVVRGSGRTTSIPKIVQPHSNNLRSEYQVVNNTGRPIIDLLHELSADEPLLGGDCNVFYGSPLSSGLTVQQIGYVSNYKTKVPNTADGKASTLGRYDRQVIRLCGATNVKLLNYNRTVTVDPDGNIEFSNIALNSTENYVNLNPYVPIILQFYASDGLWHQIG